jgi:hypothetical protein
MTSVRLLFGAAAASLAVIVAACGGGGGGSTAPAVSSIGVSTPIAVATAGSTATQSVAVSIIIPKKASSASATRTPAYIPANTQALTFQLVSVNGVGQTGAPQGPFVLTLANPNCTTVASGLSCTLTVNAPVGTDIFSATSYSDAGATVQLGSGAVALTVQNNARNTASLVLTGPLASVTIFSSTTTLTNGNPSPQPTLNAGAVARRNEAAATHRGGLTLRSTTGSVQPVTSSRIFVVAVDSQGNQIINPTTYDVPITLSLSLLGLPPNVVTLGATYAGLSAADTGSASTTTDGGTITTYAPSDQITLTISGALPSPALSDYFPTVTAHYTPQGGSPQTAGPITYDVSANPLSLSFSINVTHSTPLTTGVAGTMSVTVSNTSTTPSSGTVTVNGYVQGVIPGATPFSATNSTFWSCTTNSVTTYGFNYQCNSNAGQTVPASGNAPVITVNIVPAAGNTYFVDDVYLAYTYGTLLEFYDSDTITLTSIGFSGTNYTAAPTPPATFTASSNGNAAVLDFGNPPSLHYGTVSIMPSYAYTGMYSLVGTDACTSAGIIDSAFDTALGTTSATGANNPVSFPLNVQSTTNAGPCSITIQDTNNNQATLTIQVEQTSVTVNAKQRQK